MTDGTDPRERTSREGLYRADSEHDACGVGFVADVHGRASHAIVSQALGLLTNLEHRGASGNDPLTGDGAGILLQIPHDYYARECMMRGMQLPPAGWYGVGMLFLPQEPSARAAAEALVLPAARASGCRVVGWRDVPVEPMQLGRLARATFPLVRQVFVAPVVDRGTLDAFERRLYLLRKRVERAAREAKMPLYACSFSARTIVYKGLLLPDRMARFYRDLGDPSVSSAIAVVHQRFSTNTFPSWDRAHPYRMVSHNGEINALRGNMNAMRAREALLGKGAFGEDSALVSPVIQASGSDSAMFDNVLEMLVQGGRTLPHALAMMVPEAWENDAAMPSARRAFYEYHSSMMEPWDGPAALVVTDGVRVVAMLDRNGLRPFRVLVTHDGLVVGASEAGAVNVEPSRVAKKTRVAPGRMLVVDTAEQRVLTDEEVKESLASRRPYRVWLGEQVPLAQLETKTIPAETIPLQARQRAHSYTQEELRLVLSPMARAGEEAVGSMGNDAPPALLSRRDPLLYDYFRQLFAQVTNPPIDPIREAIVMSLRGALGTSGPLLEETPAHCRHIVLPHPVLSAEEFSRVLHCDRPGLKTRVLSTLFPSDGEEGALRAALDTLCASATEALHSGATILVLSDRGHDRERAAIPALLALAAVHHHLIREGLRGRCGLVVDTGEAREVMHFCLLVGFGAGAVHPSVACESVAQLAAKGELGEETPEHAVANYLKAANKGIAKVMSKMGISTLQSYRGAQIFEAVGLDTALVEQYFTGTATRLGGVGLAGIARETHERHQSAWRVPLPVEGASGLEPGGQYQWRRRGEHHEYSPEVIGLMQHAVRSGNYRVWKRYTAAVHEASRRTYTIRGLLKFVPGNAVPIDQVEPASEIVRRFKTGAMSFGSISREAHETLAIAMNRIGGKSNSGEGGEDSARFLPDPNGDWRRSAIKQVASGRFGVTSHYLVNADELQIKMAQGAKPGEGGQLPGHKVDETIARVRMATPGVQLISPPPHHDIYSIEDLAQLIYDLKNANDRARVSVKLVSEVGVGTVAAGVAKAKADVILISGDAGGTGAAPLTSLRHAGVPWELGLAEAQQTLVLNNLRGRVRLEVDGQLKTGRDVVVAALLGAEEFGFATSALIASGCVLMRVCHLNTCPVGIATQDPELRKRFPGQPDHVVNFMLFLAEEVRELMAELGFRTIDEMIGRTDRLAPLLENGKAEDPTIEHWKLQGIDLLSLLHRASGDATRCVEAQEHGLAQSLDVRLIDLARSALDRQGPVELDLPITNRDRTVCTRLSAEISRRYGSEGLPAGTIRVRFEGSAGQSFAAFLAEGVEATLVGEANDYLGKGLSGGRVIVVPPKGARFAAEDNAIVGNTVLYGATGGEVFLRGRAGERFAVRNSGAIAVVEGVGDHGCEYMTRGTVVVLGTTGRNFAAGMTGGIAYILDSDGGFSSRCNAALVELGRPDEQELATLRALVLRHYEFTASALAWRVLAGWKEQSQRFVRVLPIEERKARERAREKEKAFRSASSNAVV